MPPEKFEIMAVKLYEQSKKSVEICGLPETLAMLVAIIYDFYKEYPEGPIAVAASLQALIEDITGDRKK